ncbi:hypothetical protein KL905_002660 [Ogataea polymorpha]|nr:hypothetical protein KL937_002248 [Ogataea polymorpha]KAG7899925.1 hypothetical protein KL935_003466 [Ogataea polymorpha]KAG7906764.1 hypothetical protein KL907_002404 [Ogataea polymorpha]KAG7917711.1 hypothetical protein KL927_002454 [Ogataea polymorpha]KAG7921895.1 hypothetical protein KL905_002660 [Ogataea polymorpha]
MGPRCKNCGSTEFERDHKTASSDLACARCGTVIEENPIVLEVTFGEAPSGAAMLQGSIVGADQTRANFGNNRGSLDSREQTLQNGKKRIRNVAAALKIKDYIADAACQWFQLALTNNFVQGRRSQNVVAACLYIACRKEKTHHMLIDFSSRLQISVYAVGATFLKMVKALHITSLPLVDPSLFIQNFAEKLDFGRMLPKVINDAIKLAHRMSEDWIHEGRRPAGIAGACILLAARMNNFRRTHSEIVAVTHIGESTIQKRLNEFKNTNASGLTVEEFRERGQVKSTLPPSFQKNRKSEKKLKSQLQRTNPEDVTNDPVLAAILEDSKLSEKEIQEHVKRVLQRQKRDKLRKLNATIGEENEEEEEATSVQDLEFERMIERNRPRNLLKALPKTEALLSRIPDDPDNLDDADDDEINNILLTEEESKLKERLWVGSNQEFLLAQETKRLKEDADRIAGHNQHPKRRKRAAKTEDKGNDLKSEYGEYLSGASSHLGLTAALNQELSAADSAKSMLKNKSLSKKINYEAVNELFDDN